MNLANDRKTIFKKPEDYDAFIRILDEGLRKYPVELFSFGLIPNHWHLVLRPNKDGQMGRLLHWVSASHTLRYHQQYHRRGYGHLYQSRFKIFPVQSDQHFYVVCQYIERNPWRACLVEASEDWPHGSLFRRCCRPFGDKIWADEIAERHGLWYTIRPIGRRRKKPPQQE